MRRIITTTITTISLLALLTTGSAFAQEMMGAQDANQMMGGQAVSSANLTDEEAERRGEQMMELMMGQNHEAMDKMMEVALGKDGLRQMHIAMGRMGMGGMMSMMPMMMNMMSGGMMGGWSSPFGFSPGNNFMMGGASQFGNWFMTLFVILFWILVIVALVLLIRWLFQRSGSRENSALEILKERYAKGEISKKEFEEKKKDLS